jgi:hypothetical protein
LGQFYWNVSIGERVYMADYVCPPYSLSEEQSDTEVTWSRSTYMPKKEVEKIFDVELRKPAAGTVGLNQPYPHKGIYKAFFALMAVAVAVFVIGNLRNRGKIVTSQNFSFDGQTVNESQVQFSEAFTLKGKRNIEIEAYAPVSNSWVYMQFDLINEKSGGTTFFDQPIEYYSGIDWTEGSQTNKKVIGAVGKGTYILRAAAERKDWRMPMRVRVTIREGVMLLRYLLGLGVVLLVLPFFTFLHHRSFEQSRWSDASESGPFWAQESDS